MLEGGNRLLFPENPVLIEEKTVSCDNRNCTYLSRQVLDSKHRNKEVHKTGINKQVRDGKRKVPGKLPVRAVLSGILKRPELLQYKTRHKREHERNSRTREIPHLQEVSENIERYEVDRGRDTAGNKVPEHF
jgi:hypothetical protein